MFKRGVALFVYCAVSSVAFAGATIELVAIPSGSHSPGDTIMVDVNSDDDALTIVKRVEEETVASS